METQSRRQRLEYGLETVIFCTRWVLAPAYVVLCACVLVLSYKTIEELVQLLINLKLFNETQAILQVLTIVDLVLVLNLVLMVIFVGYVNFVSQIKVKEEREEDWPVWMTYLDYSGLKLQLLGSIIAVASIKMLRTFVELIDVGKVEPDRLFWMITLYAAFLAAVLIVAIVNKLKVSTEDNVAAAHKRKKPATITHSAVG